MSARELSLRVTAHLLKKGYTFDRQQIADQQARLRAEKEQSLQADILAKAREHWSGSTA